MAIATILGGCLGAEPAPEATPTDAEQAATASGIMASYNGTMIDLSKEWGSAQICAEFTIGDVRCYDTDQDVNQAIGNVANLAVNQTARKVDTLARSNCPLGWVCLYQDINYNRGNPMRRKLMWHDPGHKKLAQWHFRDQASSIANARIQFGVTVVDYRSWPLINPWIAFPAGSEYPDLRKFSYYYGGNWNDKIDEVQM